MWWIANGDSREVLRAMADASVDSVVCDPPYELGFMGKRWDASGIAYDVDLWREVLRVLKPGGHLLAFGGTRTYHRMTCAIEDAGFEIRDSIHWVFGCLSEDTEILVNGEWAHYSKAMEGSLALCYDAGHDAYSLQPIERLFVYDYDDTAYRIESADTDQLVSRNHRCLVERGGKWEFVVAEEVAREQEARVPILETLSDLLDALCLPKPHAGGPKQAMCAMPTVATESAKTTPQDENGASVLRGLRRDSCSAPSMAQEGQAACLLPSMQRAFSGARVEATRAQGTCGVDGSIQGVLPQKDVGRTESSLEWRYDVQAEQGQLCGAEVCSMSCGVFGNGPQGWVCDGTQAGSRANAGEMPVADGSRASHRPRHAEQQPVEPNAVCEQQGPQAVRASRFTRTSLARVTPVHYTGTVWCVKVPTGAFVARRNGKVFVTGNSGFPKSLDVSKAIDKAAGAEREVIGNTGRDPYRMVKFKEQDGIKRGPTNEDITAPATEAARQWSGWGTALKPAHEPCVVARKPLDGTVAANVLAHGVGALNVDGCRIAGPPSEGGSSGDGMGFNGGTATRSIDRTMSQGRWPANIVFDEDAARELDEQSGTLKSGKMLPTHTNAGRNTYGQNAAGGFTTMETYGDSGGASRFFYCAKASKADRDSGLDDFPIYSGATIANRAEGSAGSKHARAGTVGPRANTHPTVKPTSLMRWLVRLVTQPGGLVLDPFAGSGSTGVAAMLEGFRFAGIELSPEYAEIARARVAHAEANRPTTLPGLGVV